MTITVSPAEFKLVDFEAAAIRSVAERVREDAELPIDLEISIEVDESTPLGRARVVRSGADVTVVSIAKGVRDALEAANQLAAEGVELEVVDLRSLRPLDVDAVLASVARTNRLLAVEEGPRTGGWAAGIAGIVASEGLHDLDDVWTITTAETPVPYSPSLEDAFLPGAAEIAAAVRSRLGSGVSATA